MLTRLPRELRDMVYTYLWNGPEVLCNHPSMRRAATPNTNQYGNFQRDPYVAQPEEHPYFIKPEYMGPIIALEVVEAWYKSYRYPFLVYHDHNLQRLVTSDVFGVGLDPTDVLRKVHVELNMDDIVCRPGSTTTEAVSKPSLEILLKIKNKCGFQLNVLLRQRRIRLNDWLPAFESCQAVCQALTTEGALVRIYWTYHEPGTYRIERDLDVLFADPKSDWRKEAIEFLDSVSRTL
jgi:hypothetical protein